MGRRSFLQLPFVCQLRKRSTPETVNVHQSHNRAGRMCEASIVHALIVIFLEYFSWGLLTVPVINVLAETFPSNKFLMNGIILGLKGFLSFLSAPLIGHYSDICGRRKFLLLTVFFTCIPIPFLKISPWWYFTLFTLSGFFSVTFTVVLAYVADITEPRERTSACGLVSATFAASLITSPALGAWLSRVYSDDVVVLAATVVFLLDVAFIILAVPESLRVRIEGGGKGKSSVSTPPSVSPSSDHHVSWPQEEPFFIIRLIKGEKAITRLAAIVFLSYLPEAGQFSCFFVYLKLVVGFSPEQVAAFIAFVGILSVASQTGILLLVTRYFGPKHTISLALFFQFLQLAWYGLGVKNWMMWSAGLLAAMSQMSYPSISAYVSLVSDRELQGTVQGVLSGVRGLCQGVGPAIFGFIFYLFDMDLNVDGDGTGHIGVGPAFPMPNIRIQPFESKVITPTRNNTSREKTPLLNKGMIIPGPPFLFGALFVFIAILVNLGMPSRSRKVLTLQRSGSRHLDSLLIPDVEKMEKE